MGNARKQILLIRPQARSESFSAELRDLGYTTVISPVLGIEYKDTKWPDISGYQGIIATSVYGVESLSKAFEGRDVPLYLVGKNTSAAAADLGFSAIRKTAINAQTLADEITADIDNKAQPFLYVRGEDISFQMKDALSSEGIVVDEHIAYSAEAITMLSVDVQGALKNKAIGAVPFFSVRSAKIFIENVEKAGLSEHLKGIKALCISQSVLEYVRPAFGGEAYVAQSPDRKGITALIAQYCESIDMSEGMEKDTMSGANSSKKKAIENGAEIIERFGGIRPLAKKIDVAVTTVQGWKKRDTIPATRRDVIIEAAADHNVDLSDLMSDAPDVQDAANENTESVTETEEQASEQSKAEPSAKPQASVPPVSAPKKAAVEPEIDAMIDEKLAEAEKKAVDKNTIIVVALIAIVLLAVAALVWPKAKDEATLDRLSALEARTQELTGEVAEVQENVEEQQSFFGTIIPEDLNEQLSTLKEQASTTTQQVVDKTREVSADVLADDAGTITDRAIILEEHLQEITGGPVLAGMLGNLHQLQSQPGGQQVLDQAMAQLSALIANMPEEAIEAPAEEGEVGVFESALNQARNQSDALGQTFEDVPASELKAAAMLLTMQQLRSSLNRDNDAFEGDFEVLMGLIGEENIELRASLEKLAPHAQDGVLTPAGLTDEFKTIAGDAVIASLKGEDVSLQDRAAARFNEVLQIEKDGELVTGTETQAQISAAENLLEDGQIEEAMQVVRGIDGPAGKILSDWLNKAQATLNAQSLSNNLTTGINMRAFGVEDVTTLLSGEGLPSGSQLIQDSETGINIYTPGRRPGSGPKPIGNANPYD